MADLTASLRSLRDSLRELLARTAKDIPRADRVTRVMLKVNALLQGDADGSDDDIEDLRSITEAVAVCDPAHKADFDHLLDRLERLLHRL